MPSSSTLDSASRSQSEEGGGWSSVGGGCGKIQPGDTVPPLCCLQCCHGLTPPSTVHPRPLLPLECQMRAPRWIMTYPSLPGWQFPLTINATTSIMTMKKSKEGTSWSKGLDNQTNDVIAQDRLGSGELNAIVTFSKKHLHFQINWGSVYKGFFFVKLM